MKMKMTIKSAFYLSATIAIIVASGWILNIYKLATECDFVAPYKCEAIRVVGLVPPIGMVVGWLDLGK